MLGELTLGMILDQEATYDIKADQHAILTTKEYLDGCLDYPAKLWLQRYGDSHNLAHFYRRFFLKYGHVLGRQAGDMRRFICENPSACTIALIRQMSQE